MTLRMGDAVEVANLPAGLDYYAGYISGQWPNAVTIQARFPKAHVMTIATSAAHDADVLDVETDDATPAQAPTWVARQHARGVTRPVVYANWATMPAVLAALTASRIGRGQVRLWVAHYLDRAHICSPAACHADGFTADGTQWTTHGNTWDESQLADTFFTDQPAPAPSAPVEDDMKDCYLKQDSKGRVWFVNVAGPTKLYVSTPALVKTWQYLFDLNGLGDHGTVEVAPDAWLASLHTLPNGG